MLICAPDAEALYFAIRTSAHLLAVDLGLTRQIMFTSSCDISGINFTFATCSARRLLCEDKRPEEEVGRSRGPKQEVTGNSEPLVHTDA